MKYAALLIAFILTVSLTTPNPAGPVLDKDEARAAFEYLNKIRANPAAYAAELKLPANITTTKTQLVWNDTLARVAEIKALDMAKNNYFGHVDKKGYGMNYYINKAGYKLPTHLLQSKDMNAFESIAAGYDTGEEVIKILIIDKGVPSLSHRKHLLGMGGYAKTKDIGIGFARIDEGSTYTTYISLLIAFH